MPFYPLRQDWVITDKHSYHGIHYCGITYRHEYLRPSRSHHCQSREYLKKMTFIPSCTGAQSAFNILHTEFSLINWSHFPLSVKRHSVNLDQKHICCNFIWLKSETVVVMCLCCCSPVCLYLIQLPAVKLKSPYQSRLYFKELP